MTIPHNIYMYRDNNGGPKSALANRALQQRFLQVQVCNTCCPDNYCDDVLLKFDFDALSVRQKETE